MAFGGSGNGGNAMLPLLVVVYQILLLVSNTHFNFKQDVLKTADGQLAKLINKRKITVTRQTFLTQFQYHKTVTESSAKSDQRHEHHRKHNYHHRKNIRETLKSVWNKAQLLDKQNSKNRCGSKQRQSRISVQSSRSHSGVACGGDLACGGTSIETSMNTRCLLVKTSVAVKVHCVERKQLGDWSPIHINW